MPDDQWRCEPVLLIEVEITLRTTRSAPGGTLWLAKDTTTWFVRTCGIYYLAASDWSDLNRGRRMEFAPGIAGRRRGTILLVWQYGHPLGICGWNVFAIVVGLVDRQNFTLSRND